MGLVTEADERKPLLSGVVLDVHPPTVSTTADREALAPPSSSLLKAASSSVGFGRSRGASTDPVAAESLVRAAGAEAGKSSSVLPPPSTELSVLLGSQPIFQLYTKRWYILFIFSFFSFLQSLAWLGFSGAPDAAKQYYGIDDATVNWLLNMGCIVYLPVMPVVGWLQIRPNGLRTVTLVGNALVVLGALARLVPCWLSPSLRSGSTLAVALLFVGQILNAAAGPCTMAPVSQLSAAWFAANERSFATAIASQASNFGACIGYVLIPLLVPTAADMPRLLYVLAGAAAAVALACGLHFPSLPPAPPSAAAADALLRSQPHQAEPQPQSQPQPRGEPRGAPGAAGGGGVRAYLRGVRAALANPSCALLIVAGGLQSGAFSSWNGAVPDMLAAQHVDPARAGLFAFACSLAGIAGGIALGKVADRLLRRRLKLLVLLCFAASVAFFVWFTLSLPLLSLPPVLPSTPWSLFAAITLSGLFIGAVNPLLYEFAAELTFPVPEATSAALLTWTLNLGGFILLLCASEINLRSLNLVLLIAIVVSMAMIAAVRERYCRLDLEASVEQQAVTVQ